MTTYSFAQLEQLWINAGGSKALAPYAAATALVESGGNPQAYNASGATGLWQIEYPGSDKIGASQTALYNAETNAKAAVALSGNTMAGLLSNWTAYEPAGAAEAIMKQHGGTAPSSAGIQGVQPVPAGVSAGGTATPSPGSSPGGGTSGPNAPPSSSDLTGLLGPIKNLLHAVATVIDYAFAMFQPGQGPRFLFGLLSLAAVLMAFKVLAPSGGIPHGW